MGHVRRNREIMNLLSLALEIQEQILLLPPIQSGKNKITERNLRQISGEVDWRMQRQGWRQQQDRKT